MLYLLNINRACPGIVSGRKGYSVKTRKHIRETEAIQMIIKRAAELNAAVSEYIRRLLLIAVAES